MSACDPKQPPSCLRSIGEMTNRNLAIILFASLLMVSGCDSPQRVIQYDLSADGIPRGVDEALVRLREIISPQAQASFQRCAQAGTTESCRDFGVQFELPLLRQISNDWMRPTDSPLANSYRQSGLDNPEVMAAALVREFVESLQETG